MPLHRSVRGSLRYHGVDSALTPRSNVFMFFGSLHIVITTRGTGNEKSGTGVGRGKRTALE